MSQLKLSISCGCGIKFVATHPKQVATTFREAIMHEQVEHHTLHISGEIRKEAVRARMIPV